MSDVYLLTTDKFREAVVSHSEQGIRVLRYAMNFVNWMNRRGRLLDDVTSPLNQSGEDEDGEDDEFA